MQHLEVGTADNDSFEEVDVFDNVEQFNGEVPLKNQNSWFQIKLLQIIFGIGILLLVFSFGYKLGSNEKGGFYTYVSTMQPTVYPTESPTILTEGPTIPTESTTMPTESPTIHPTNETNFTT